MHRVGKLGIQCLIGIVSRWLECLYQGVGYMAVVREAKAKQVEVYGYKDSYPASMHMFLPRN